MFAFFSKKSLKITLEANLLLGFAQSNRQHFCSRKLTGNGTSGMTCWKCDGREWTIWVHGYGSDSCGTSGLGVERNFFSRKGHIHAVKRHYECAITYLAWWMRGCLAFKLPRLKEALHHFLDSEALAPSPCIYLVWCPAIPSPLRLLTRKSAHSPEDKPGLSPEPSEYMATVAILAERQG